MDTSRRGSILFTAFEPSGDAHAAPVIRALKARDPALRIYAWGGPKMAAAGAEIVMELYDTPYGSREYSARDPEGNPFCFGFNLGTCPHKDVQPGQRCPKGWHKCRFEGCGAVHPLKGNR